MLICSRISLPAPENRSRALCESRKKFNKDQGKVVVQFGTTGGGVTPLQNRGAVATGSTLRNDFSAYD